MRLRKSVLCTSILLLAVFTTCGHAAPPPTVAQTMQFKPIQVGVDYETPKADDMEKCRVEPAPANAGWVVFGPGGQVLRKFLDTDQDGTVDTRKFYSLGLEVYRDIDTNKNNKIDQSRWVNTGGTRWGIDRNEDGKIDQWLVISANEAAFEAVSGLVANDPARTAAVLMSPADAKAIGLNADVTKKLAAATSDAANSIKAIMSKTRSLKKSSRWMRFDPQSPSLIPKDDGKAEQDLMILGNPMAIVETDGKTTIIQIGEMVRVNNTWKLTGVPRPIEGEQAVMSTGLLMQPAQSSLGPGGPAYSKEVQALLEELQRIDQNSPTAASTRKQRSDYNEARANLLTKLIGSLQSPDEKVQWTKQLADGLALGVQEGAFATGLERLKKLEAAIFRADKTSELVPYITYRRISGEYSARLQTSSNDKRQEAQKWYAQQLQGFWKAYPDADDTPDVLFQLALGNENINNLAEAKKWYGQLQRQFPKTENGKKGAGALRRLNMEGKPLKLAGPAIEGGTIDLGQYKGKVVLVHYWGTWCGPCSDDMPFLVALHDTYSKKGFEIVGINMDAKGSESQIAEYKKKYKMNWKSLSEPGQLEGPLARDFGIISAPTMFLIGKDGNVISRSTSTTDLKKVLPQLLK